MSRPSNEGTQTREDPANDELNDSRGEGEPSLRSGVGSADEENPTRGGARAGKDGDDEKKLEPSDDTTMSQSVWQAARSDALRPFVIISTSYLLFTVTDGALRMIVLLHAYNLRLSALQVAVMFTLYELAGVVTNLAAGIMGAKWGIKYTLISGLCLQLLSLGLLLGWQETWDPGTAIAYVTVAQMFAGIAKDLTKLGGKTVTKLVSPAEQDTKLFKLVSLLTGWKNSLKGVGYFLGSALLQGGGYYTAVSVMMALIVAAMPWAITGLSRELGTAKKKNASLREIFTWENTNLTILSLARLFLFASRDFWFEVPLPFFLRSPVCGGLGTAVCSESNATLACPTGAVCSAAADGVCENLNIGGGCGGLGLSRVAVGAFLGGYIILYGQVQSWTPQLVTGPLRQTPPNKLTEVWWGIWNCFPTAVAAIVVQWSYAFVNQQVSAMTTALVIVIVVFAVIFAINSSIHSYLVVKYASHDKVAVSVGLYYMSNAIGRLIGTLGSGFLYTYVGGDPRNAFSGTNAVSGLAACFFAGTLSSVVAAAITVFIRDQQVGLKCGPCWTLVQAEESADDNDDEPLPNPIGEEYSEIIL
jgi:MFS family permease